MGGGYGWSNQWQTVHIVVLYFYIYSNARQGIFLNLALKCMRCLKFTYEAPNQIALNRATQSQTKACITKQSVRLALSWDILQPRLETRYWCFGTTYWSHLQGSKHWKDKTQHALTQSYFLGLRLSSNLLTQHSLSEASSGSVFRQRTCLTT